MTTERAKELRPEELLALIEQGADLFVVDVRNDEEFKAWQVEGRRPIPTVHVPYFEALGEAESDDPTEAFVEYTRRHWLDQLPQGGQIVAVCAKGGTSAHVAEALRRLGYNAANLQGGMVAWGNHYAFKTVTEEPELSIDQVIRPARGCLSHIIASRGEAVIVDPLRHADRYREFLKARGLKLVAVLDTHAHADHISSGPALAREHQVPYHFHPYDGIHPMDVLPAAIPYEFLKDGQEIRVGSARIQALHVPGHTLGNLVYRVNDQYLLTGDTIFIDSIARPDLGGRGESWAPIHYRSLARLVALPEETVVLPGHFSRPAEASHQGIYMGTLGELKQRNEGLRQVLAGEEAFVSFILSSLPSFPQQYVDIKRVNAGLLAADEEKAEELELGRNICALSQAYDSAAD